MDVFERVHYETVLICRQYEGQMGWADLQERRDKMQGTGFCSHLLHRGHSINQSTTLLEAEKIRYLNIVDDSMTFLFFKAFLYTSKT